MFLEATEVMEEEEMTTKQEPKKCPNCGSPCVTHWGIKNGKRVYHYMCLRCENIFGKGLKGYTSWKRSKLK